MNENHDELGRFSAGAGAATEKANTLATSGADSKAVADAHHAAADAHVAAAAHESTAPRHVEFHKEMAQGHREQAKRLDKAIQITEHLQEQVTAAEAKLAMLSSEHATGKAAFEKKYSEIRAEHAEKSSKINADSKAALDKTLAAKQAAWEARKKEKGWK